MIDDIDWYDILFVFHCGHGTSENTLPQNQLFYTVPLTDCVIPPL